MVSEDVLVDTVEICVSEEILVVTKEVLQVV